MEVPKLMKVDVVEVEVVDVEVLVVEPLALGLSRKGRCVQWKPKWPK